MNDVRLVVFKELLRNDGMNHRVKFCKFCENIRKFGNDNYRESAETYNCCDDICGDSVHAMRGEGVETRGGGWIGPCNGKDESLYAIKGMNLPIK